MIHKPTKPDGEPESQDNQAPPPLPEQPGDQSPTAEPTAQLQAELDDLMDRLKRTTADYQNYQKRVVREMADARRYANAEFAREILTIVDDLERAMQVGPDSPAASALLDGIRITHEHLVAMLARHGVTPIEAVGQPFNPQLHEAMMQEASEKVPPLTVLKELARGYMMHDRVLRPARVVVSSGGKKSDE
jgi:molecular chaperone GrpE